MLRIGWGPMPSGWLRLTSIPREPLPYRWQDIKQLSEMGRVGIPPFAFAGTLMLKCGPGLWTAKDRQLVSKAAMQQPRTERPTAPMSTERR